MNDKTGWLIETGDHKYWDGRAADGTAFTSEHLEAVRFARKEDADRIINWLLEKHRVFLVAREHSWMTDARALSATST